MKLYVGNLPFSHNESELRNLFSPYGEVVSSKVITDFQTGRSRGFGFVEMSTRSEGQKALEAVNRTSVKGRELIVNEARKDKKRNRR